MTGEGPAAEPSKRLSGGGVVRRAPVSFAQQRLWLLERMFALGAVYHTPHVLRLRGAVDIAALEAALNEIARRHETLRTRFEESNGEPVQVVLACGAVALHREDMRSVGRTTLLTAVKAEVTAPFDLARELPLRVRLWQVGDDEHWLAITLHHIATDGWSTGVLARELSALYNATRAGRPSPLPPLPVQYGDYAAWQRDWLHGDVLDRQLAFWRRGLAGVPVLDLPGDRPRPLVPTFRGERVTIRLDATTIHGLRALGAGQGATLFMVLLAAFDVLLHRHTGQDDFAVGVPIAGRSRPELEDLIGFFVNMLVMRFEMSGSATFSEVLAQVRARALDAYAHPDVPFDLVVEALAPARDASRNPLFQASFVLHNTPPRHWHLEGVDVEPMTDVVTGTCKFDLSLIAVPVGPELALTFEYACDLFDRSTIERLGMHFRELLGGILSTPHLPIERLPLLTPAERADLIGSLPQNAHIPCTVVTQFEAQVDATPEAPAVLCGDRRLTYRALDARADSLASELRDLGVGPDVIVGLCLPRSLELVVGMLGILKAGGAYLPLDPEYPRERLAFMLQDCAAPVVITAAGVGDLLPADFAGRVLFLNRDDGPPPHQARAGRPAGPRAADLAYVIYTSGSTGQPNGVLIEHGALANHIVWMQRRFPLTLSDRVLQKTALGFDAAVWEFHAPLIAGATLVMAEPGLQRSPAQLVACVRREAITVLQMVPSLLAAVLDHPGLAGCTSLRRVFAGGEVLTCDTVRRFRSQSHATLVNLYGPTEVTIDATAWEIGPADETSAPPIGTTIDNVRAYVLSPSMEPVPPGVVGELYLGGAGVARGYLNRPVLSRERFVADPLLGAPAARLFRTGDRVRRRTDGALEFIGRRDAQVKIRGHRIEPAEIEASLTALPDVADAAVVAADGPAAQLVLIAYVTAKAGREVHADQLRSLLRARLPEPMVPAIFVVLRELPRLPNGKLDRRNLPTPSGVVDHVHGGPRVAPRDGLEEQVAALWGDVLHVESVGVHDDFFASGGHSLLAMQLIARLHAVFGIELPMRTFFAGPTIADVALHLRNAHERGTVYADPIGMAAGDLPTPSLAQQRLWLLERLVPCGSAYTVANGWRLEGKLDVGALRAALLGLAQRQDVLRARFAVGDGSTLRLQEAPDALALQVEDLTAMPPTTRAAHAMRLATEEAAAPFDLARGPLARARLLRLDDSHHWLLVTMHHAVIDGWSMSVLARELSVLYAAALQGVRAELPPLPVRYADYAAWQRAGLRANALDESMAYWKKELAGVQPFELPSDRPRPPIPSLRGDRVPFVIDDGLTRSLEALARDRGATLFMVLLATFQLLLARYAGRDDVAVGVPVAGRGRPELEGLIGLFVNMLVLRGDVAAADDFAAYLEHTRARVLGALQHQDVPFERLVEDLAPSRDVARHPLFQVAFVLQNTPAEHWEVPGLAVEKLDSMRPASAKFDLSLSVTERDGSLHAQFEFATDLFERHTIAQLARHWQMLMRGVVADPTCSLARLPLMDEQERADLLAPGVCVPLATTDGLAAIVAEITRRSPGAIALVEDDTRITYAELEARSNRLAHHLQATGVGSGQTVAVILPRSAGFVVAILAVLKAGGAYVPLDPEFPFARLEALATDAGCRVVITDAAGGERAPRAMQMVCLDRDGDAIARHPAEPVHTPVLATELACILYTSGSSGSPKGVAIRQRSIVRLVREQDYVRIGAADVVAHLSNVAFDAATFELWGALLNGARLAILPKAMVLAPASLQQNITRQRITCMLLTTSVFHHAVDHDPAMFRDLRYLLFGGESADPVRVRAVLDAGPPRHFVNAYGPTEATTIAACHEIVSQDPSQPVPIGRPIVGTEITVLDRYGEPVPIGVLGELAIGGDGVAAGYVGSARTSAERFVDDPRRPAPGRRAYRTGDLGRRRRDGIFEFGGRVDDQVKLRGHRIEPGEIRALISGHAGVRGCHVQVEMLPNGTPGLVAYVAGPAADFSTIHDNLVARLPGYMIPDTLVRVEAIPLSDNGKVDTRALETGTGERWRLRHTFVAPRDEIEQAICGTWADVLQVDAVGVDDNFFDLGGHSLLAARVFAHLDESLGRVLPLATLFEAPTVRGLAARYRDAPLASHAGSLVAVQPRGRRPPLFVVPGIFGDVVGLGPLSRALGTEQPLYALRSAGLADDAPPLATIEAMASAYVREIRSVRPHGPYAIGGSCFGATVAYEMARQLLSAGEAVAFLALLDPSRRGGRSTLSNSIATPRILRRAAAAMAFGAGRARMYVTEAAAMRGHHRWQYVVRKLRTVAAHRGGLAARAPVVRELDRVEVQRTNLRALERYARADLPGKVRVVCVLESTRDTATRTPLPVGIEQAGQRFVRATVPGRDSGDMLAAANAAHVAQRLETLLREAYTETDSATAPGQSTAVT